MAYIEDIARHAGHTVTLRVWLHNRRSSGKIHFLTVRDGTGFIQAVMSKKTRLVGRPSGSMDMPGIFARPRASLRALAWSSARR